MSTRSALRFVAMAGGARAVDVRRERLDYRQPMDWRGNVIVDRPPPAKVDISEIAARLIARAKAKAAG